VTLYYPISRKLMTAEYIHTESEAFLNDPGSTAFSALTVDPYDRLIRAADVLWIKREVWDLPLGGVSGLITNVKSFLDCILMRSTEGAYHELPTVGGSWVNWYLVCFFYHFDDGI